MSASFASSVVALLVALFNALLAGHALAGEQRREGLLFALSPVGVALFALGWFLAAVHPAAVWPMRVLAGVGGAVAASGVTLDALRLAGGNVRRRMAMLGLAVGVLGGAGSLVLTHLGMDPSSAVPRLVALVLVAVLGTFHWRQSCHGPSSLRRFSRHAAFSVAVSLVAFAALFALALARGNRVDPLLGAVLATEVVCLVYIVHHRVPSHLLLPRALIAMVVMLLLVFGATALLRVVGPPLDLTQVATSVVLGVLAAVVFMALSRFATRQLVRWLFPEQARLSAVLAASQGELSALRGRLERAERLAIAGELAASVAHEIKNPLAALRGYAQLLGSARDHVDADFREQFEKAVRIIREESDRIDRRVGELLSLGRRSVPSRDESADLNRVTAEAVAVAEGEADAPDLVLRLDPSVGRVAGNADEIRSALSNLLKNAAEAMLGRPGQVVVSTRVDGKRAVVEIADDGPGLSPEMLADPFHPFRSTKPAGTGLGLCIARSAVESAGGVLLLRVRPEGTGTLARIELERKPEARGDR